jgi:hypothetical protein
LWATASLAVFILMVVFLSLSWDFKITALLALSTFAIVAALYAPDASTAWLGGCRYGLIAGLVVWAFWALRDLVNALEKRISATKPDRSDSFVQSVANEIQDQTLETATPSDASAYEPKAGGD